MNRKFSINRKEKIKKVRRTKRKRKTRVRIAVLSFFGVILIVLVASYFLQQSSPTKEPAHLYFEVEPGVLIGDLLGNTWAVHQITFSIRPVGGDANNLIILSWAMGDDQELGDITQNQSVPVLLQARSPDLIEPNEAGKIPVEIRVYSREAEGTITIEFPPPQT